MKGYLLKKALDELDQYYALLDKLSSVMNIKDYEHLGRVEGLINAIEDELRSDTKQEELPK